ncbi:MAG: hypothetical protein ISS65_10815 [Desulfobacterales bacterium]|nr:hypothetical protein [Desulfobacterales bacterium]MBU0698966.1 hypothetical protein [Pseudomonadota bacterium]
MSAASAVESVGQGIPDTLCLQKIPERPRDAITGLQFARETTGMTGEEQQSKALGELRRGNIPDFLRKLKPVHFNYRKPRGEMITAIIWATPDYVAIGSDEDFLRIPLTYPSAVAVAEAFECVLPTPKMVDAIYEQSTCHLEPDPLPPGPMMRSSEYFLKHREMIRNQRQQAGCALGELVSGHKKDVVITNRLNRKPGRIAIYGWHTKNGEPIQPLSIFHGKNYADYSHGLRLIYKTVWINGKPRSLLEVLQDPRVAPVLTDEGFINKLLKMLHLR